MPKVAIVGSGIAGLAAARALCTRARVTVLEAAPTPGGHVVTITAPSRHGPLAVDMGFIVCNRERYPHFFAMLEELDVPTRATAMSFSVSLPDRDLEWGSSSLGAMFADRRSLFRPGHWRFLVEVMRLLQRGQRDLARGACADLSLDEYLARARVPAEVRDGFVIPLAAALWSLAPERCGAFPAETYLSFLEQHGMLRVVRPLAWRTIVGGSQRYLDALLAHLGARGVEVRTGAAVQRVHRHRDGVTLEQGGAELAFDRVIVATHADTALALLAEPTEEERALLGAFGYSKNRTVLHSDERFLPRQRRAHASWNYVSDRDLSRVAVTYSMNHLQGHPADTPLLVTLNPRHPIAPDRVLHQADFTHPQFDAAALRAQRRLRQLGGVRHTYYAGAHFGFGFHEDGMRSGIDAAALLLRELAASGGAS
ncbi:MAG: FAD-dependent oxidoreductase [Myxococcales bacterium]|nr:FAD-dependent oxidoreductase [Myxococcales bacterium]